MKYKNEFIRWVGGKDTTGKDLIYNAVSAFAFKVNQEAKRISDRGEPLLVDFGTAFIDVCECLGVGVGDQKEGDAQ